VYKIGNFLSVENFLESAKTLIWFLKVFVEKVLMKKRKKILTE